MTPAERAVEAAARAIHGHATRKAGQQRDAMLALIADHKARVRAVRRKGA